MENYRTSSHSRYDLKYHFVWVTKYRRKVLTGEVGIRVRSLVREVCRTHEIEILQGAVSQDHVHVLLSCPPTMSPSKIMQYIKGKSSRKLMMEFKHIQKPAIPAGRHDRASTGPNFLSRALAGRFLVQITDLQRKDWQLAQVRAREDGPSERNQLR